VRVAARTRLMVVVRVGVALHEQVAGARHVASEVGHYLVEQLAGRCVWRYERRDHLAQEGQVALAQRTFATKRSACLKRLSNVLRRTA
jgi:hypothetical protein